MIDWEKLHNLLIETKKLPKRIEKSEYHHIIPKHAGGTNDKSNLVLLPRRYHILIHFIRWRWLGQKGDRLAYRLMLNSINRPIDDFEFRKICVNKMNTPEARLKALIKIRAIKKTTEYKQKISSIRKQMYIDMGDLKLVYPYLFSDQKINELKSGRKMWAENNKLSLQNNYYEHLYKFCLYRNSNMTDDEKKEFFGRGSNEKNPNWLGYYKFYHNNGMNFIFYTRKEAAKITGINSSTILKYTNTNKQIVQGKWAGFSIIRNKDIIDVT